MRAWVAALLVFFVGVNSSMVRAKTDAAKKRHFARERQPARFFSMGDGTIAIRSTKNTHRFRGRYRGKNGVYLRSALRRINRVFDAAYSDRNSRVSLRLIELLAHLRNQFGGGWVTISSGYRSPAYNKALRDKGKTVAKASLHLYGMAADFRIQRIHSKDVWQYVRDQHLGGAGYYGSPWIHIDVGPARSWTQGTANVRSGQSDENKRIIIVPQFDIYNPGDVVRMRFARMTAYPIGVHKRGFVLQRLDGDRWVTVKRLPMRFSAAGVQNDAKARCFTANEMIDLSGVVGRIPKDAQPGRYRIEAHFCDTGWKAMPTRLASYEFRVDSHPPVAPTGDRSFANPRAVQGF